MTTPNEFYSNLHDMWITLRENHGDAHNAVHNNLVATRQCYSDLKKRFDDGGTLVCDLYDEIEDLKDVIAKQAIEMIRGKR